MKHPIGILHRFGQIALLALFFALPKGSAAEEADFPEPIGYVSDFGRVMSPKYERRLADIGAELERKTGIRLRVVTLTSLQGIAIEDAAARMLAEWSESEEAKSHTVLILDAMADKKMRVEMGSEMLNILTPELNQRIQEQVMLPHLVRGEHQDAYLLCAIEVAVSVGLAEHVALYTVPGFLKLQPALHQPLAKTNPSAYELFCCAILLAFMGVMMRLQDKIAPATQVFSPLFREHARNRLLPLRRLFK
ncbi:TPM domain-containing protein [bacterium]|nr:TPM domain-containing protein [bacterium]